MRADVIVDRICQLMKIETEKVGFIPRPRVRQHIERELYRLQIDQNEIVGYMIHGPARDVVAVHQAVVDLSCRRLGFAQAMAADLEQWARSRAANALRLVCRDDLEAQQFWRAAGYQAIGWEPAGVKRRHPKTIFLRELV